MITTPPTSGTAITPLPQIYGRYIVQRKLNSGGQGTIYLGIDPHLNNKLVAIKVPDQTDGNTQLRFQREKDIALILDKNCPQIYDFGIHQATGKHYIVMEYMSGGSLRDKLRDDRPFTEEETTQFLNKVCIMLDKIHAKGIIHCDIKPGNILYDGESQPIFADFGIAKFNQNHANPPHTRITPANAIIRGTPRYRAPEQLQTKDLTPQADLYSLAVTIHELLTGETPRNHRPSRNCDAKYKQWFLKALSPDSEDRFETAQEMKNAWPKSEMAQPLAWTPAVRDTSTKRLIVMMYTLIALAVVSIISIILVNITNIEPNSTPSSPPSTSMADIQTQIFTLPRSRLQVEMSLIPSSNFLMASTHRDLIQKTEGRTISLNISEFWIDKTEVTNEQFAQFVESQNYVTTAESNNENFTWRTPYGTKTGYMNQPNHPAVQISWEDAFQFCKYRGGRLPTDAEWELATRGPSTNLYPWGDHFSSEHSNSCDQSCQESNRDPSINDSFQYTSPVSHFPSGRSPYLLDDTAGNVWEWTSTRYTDTLDTRTINDPQRVWGNTEMIIRGGGWNVPSVFLTTMSRKPAFANSYTNYIGFRCVVPSN